MGRDCGDGDGWVDCAFGDSENAEGGGGVRCWGWDGFGCLDGAHAFAVSVFGADGWGVWGAWGPRGCGGWGLGRQAAGGMEQASARRASHFFLTPKRRWLRWREAVDVWQKWKGYVWEKFV